MTKPKLFLLGGSHSKRLFKYLKDNSILEKYEVIFRKGTNFSDIALPSTTAGDLIVVWSFGNTIFNRKFLFKKANKFHLSKFAPLSLSKNMAEWQLCKTYLEKQAAKSFIISNTLRLTNCCNEHQKQHHKVAKHQHNIFKEFLHFFQDSEEDRTILIRVENLLPFSVRKAKVKQNIEKLLIDSVHFHPQTYETIAEKLVSKYLQHV